MAKHLSTARLLKAGFVLTDCSDGKFWVLEKSPGPEANHLAAVCKWFLDDVDSVDVSETIVLQCGPEFEEPVLYIDGFLWNLPQREFSKIVARIIRKGHPRSILPRSFRKAAP